MENNVWKRGMVLGAAILFIATALTPMILISRASPDPDGTQFEGIDYIGVI